MTESFARVETKYLVSLAQTDALETALRQRGFTRMDYGCPRLQSLYYDTSGHALIRASLERPAYKEKLRLRVYGESGSITLAFPEIKKKFNGVVYKRRTEMPLRQAMDSLDRGEMPKETGQVGREVTWMLRRYSLQPAAVISYDRDAWFCREQPGVRITFDRCLTFRDWDFDLNSRAPGLPLLPPELRLAEIKTGGAYPLWLTRLLEETGAERTHFSKYGLAYLRYIRPKKEGNERGEANCSIVSLSKGA